MTFTEYMGFFQDKYELICMADEEIDNFCLDVESSWNITNMVLLDEATWPTYTNKCYYDVSYGDWGWFYFENGTCLEPSNDYLQDATDANGFNQLAAWDYYVDRPPTIHDGNYGWTEPLDGITELVWTNMQLNINIIPANNYTASENINMAIAYEIPNAGIRNLKMILIAIVSSINVDECIRNQDNFTMTQFLTWNPYIGSRQISNGDATCVSPPGDLYSPPSATVSANSTYTTKAIPASPTPSGTATNCSDYYLVQDGDECGVICEGNSLKLAESIAMNPSVNANCTNLVVALDYCVATVNGTTPTTSNTTATFVSAPTTTVTGTTSECCEWHTVFSGDTCQLIEAEYGITFEKFIVLNTYVNSTCGNIWPGYAYCVSGIATANNSTSTTAITATSTSPPIPVTTSGTLTTATTSGTITTPAPTQTGMVSGCTTFYEAVSGDGLLRDRHIVRHHV
ncbi:hypothetical protein N7453_001161 [Penicillium expansum]|nr:hypothetical protein N7453_001161 [Penicillium expansum]